MYVTQLNYGSENCEYYTIRKKHCRRWVRLQKKMFSALVDVFFVPVLEVDYGVVSNLLEEGVLVNGTFVEKFFRQMARKHV
jgi:hypothetical protein